MIGKCFLTLLRNIGINLRELVIVSLATEFQFGHMLQLNLKVYTVQPGNAVIGRYSSI